MADQFTGTGQVSIDQDAYDRRIFFAFKPQLYYDQIADVKPTAQAMPGKTVKFTKLNALSPTTTPLNESIDVDAVALSDGQVTVTLEEYGLSTVTTAKVRGTGFVPLDEAVAEEVGYNAGESIDLLGRNQLEAGDNVRYAGQGTSRDTVIPTDTLAATNGRRAVAELRGASVPELGGGYVGIIHPDVSIDLREESNNTASWSDPVAYSEPERRWVGEIGKLDGVRYIESPRAPKFPDAGSSTTLTDVYGTLYVGRQALAKAWSYTDGNTEYPHVVPGPVTDKLRRFVYLGWFWLGGFERFREESIRRVESASSIGDNA